MKRRIMFMAITLLTLGMISSCDKNETEVDEEITAADKAKIKSAVESGDWMVTYYMDSDTDQTTDYVGYKFTFNTDGTLGVTNGNTSLSGAWTVTSSDTSTDDSGDEDIDFNIFFTSPDIFEELSDDWEIISYSTSKIELKDISGADGSIDYLTFEKM